MARSRTARLRSALTTVVAALLLAGAGGCDGEEAPPVTCTPGQLGVTDLTAGPATGALATATSRVILTYSTTLVGTGEDLGTVSRQEVVLGARLGRGLPVGLVDGIAGMREEGRRRITVPPNYGFGAAGAGERVPSCATLRFEVTLNEVLTPSCGGTGRVTTEDLSVGTGEQAQPISAVTVRYVGRLSTGETFDEVTADEAPASFDLENTIPGFRQGVTGMRVGGRRRITIPPDFAYGRVGNASSSPAIPSCETIEFEVQLISVDGEDVEE